jgi:SAM-dependent methyltransferase
MTPGQIVDSVKSWYSSQLVWVAAKYSIDIHKTPKCIDWRLINQGDLLRDKRVLNIGCFYPKDETTFAPLAKKWISIDFSPEVIDRCKQLNITNVDFLLMDARAMEFPTESFDVVLDFSTGDQIPENHYNQVLEEIYRVLQVGGLFVLTYANANYFNKKEDFGDFGYSRFYTPEELKAKVTQLGFYKVIEKDSDSYRSGFIFVKKEKDGLLK